MYKNRTHAPHTKSRNCSSAQGLYTLQEHYIQADWTITPLQLWARLYIYTLQEQNVHAVEFEVHEQVGQINNGIAVHLYVLSIIRLALRTYQDGKIIFDGVQFV